MDKINFILFLSIVLAGCATSRPVKPLESIPQQIDVAKKVVGALAPSASGPTNVVVEKYSPVTGKHYSGVLDYEPGTGVKLIPIKE